VLIKLTESLMVLRPDAEQDVEEASRWIASHADHVFRLGTSDGQTFLFKDLGHVADACREPINVASSAEEPTIRLISNLAHTPFDLYDKRYASVEAFWQGLKFTDEQDRSRIASLHGIEAKEAGRAAAYPEKFSYNGRFFRSGCYEHWSLMYQACWAKFTQHEAARSALLSTGKRPLTHKTRGDSRTIPGVIMADMWMKIRGRVAKGDQCTEWERSR